MTKWLIMVAFAALSVPACAHSAMAGLAEAAELEAARANARAGGPTSSRDAELLERYGCSSGTDNPVCKGGLDREHRPMHRRKRQRNNDE